MRFSTKPLLWSCVAAFLTACGPDLPLADTLVWNGTIQRTATPGDTCSALALLNGKVVATGTLAELTESWQFADSLDLQGGFAYPGFNDAHAHLVGYAQTLGECNLFGANSMEEVVQRLQDFAANAPEGMLIGRGWDQNRFPDKAFPTRTLLDKAFPDRMVYLTRVDGHAALVNGAVLERFDITAASTMEGGTVVVANGKPTGLLIDRAEELVTLPALSSSKKVALLRRAESNLLAAGITSLTDCGLPTDDILLLDSLQKAGLLHIRVNAMVADGNERINHWLKNGPLQTDFLRVHSFKFYADGALGSRGALLRKPYADDPHNFGIPVTSMARLDSVYPLLAQAGFQACTHAIGDSATHMLVGLYSRHMPKGARWRIEHAQIMERDDISAACEAGIILSVQPTHATSDAPWAQERLGEERIQMAYAYRDMLDRCPVLPLGTDFPVEDISPMATFVAAVNRQNMKGWPEEGFLLENRMERHEALRGMTEWAAYASFEEEQKGTLTVNKWADFVILDEDLYAIPMDEVPALRVRATCVGGTVVYTQNPL